MSVCVLCSCPVQTALFPERGLVFDYYFVKQASGVWTPWTDLMETQSIGANAKVRVVIEDVMVMSPTAV